MRIDPSIYLFGEGAHMKIHFDAPDIEKEFGERVITLPISEDGNTNFAVGAALAGIKPVVDVILGDFLYRTLDSICNTAAKINFVLGGAMDPRTIVIRAEYFMGGPTTGQRPEAIFAHIPGLNVAVPSAPNDARGLMLTALRTPGVTLFFEDRMISDANIDESDQNLTSNNPIPFGFARRRLAGDQLTIVSYALTMCQVESLVAQHGIECDLIDLRTVAPVDFETVCESVSRTGKLLIVEPDIKYGGVGAEIAAEVQSRCFNSLKKPIERLGAPKSTIPASQALHKYMLPTDEEILAAIRRLSN